MVKLTLYHYLWSEISEIHLNSEKVVFEIEICDPMVKIKKKIISKIFAQKKWFFVQKLSLFRAKISKYLAKKVAFFRAKKNFFLCKKTTYFAKYLDIFARKSDIFCTKNHFFCEKIFEKKNFSLKFM